MAITIAVVRFRAVGFIDWLDAVPYGRGCGLGRGRGVGTGLGVAEGVAVAVAVAVGVGEPFNPLQYISIELSGVTPSDAYPPTSQM